VVFINSTQIDMHISIFDLLFHVNVIQVPKMEYAVNQRLDWYL